MQRLWTHKKVFLREDQIIDGAVKKQKLNHDHIIQEDVEVRAEVEDEVIRRWWKKLGERRN